MKKFLLVTFIVFGLFVVKSVSAEQAFADQTISVVLDNRSGGINVDVTLTFSGQVGSNISPAQITQTANKYVAGGTTGFTTVSTVDIGTQAHAPYNLVWTNVCGDSGTLSTSTADTSGNYTFSPSPDVHCKSTNSAVTITATSCPLNAGVNTGHADWSVSNAPNANIANFKVYRALAPANADSDTNPLSLDFIAGQSPYGADFGSLANGTWNVKVIAYPPNYSPNGDNGVSSFDGTFTCGAGVSNPANLNTSVGCSGGQNRIDFSWSGAMPGNFDYVVQTNQTTDPGPGGTWADSATPNPPTNTYVSTVNVFTAASGTYWWRVKATPSPQTVPATYYYSSSKSFITPASCATSYSVPVINRAITCAPPSVPNNWDMQTYAWAGGVNANSIAFQWIRAYPDTQIWVNEEYIEYSMNSDFSSGVTSVPAYMTPAPADGHAAKTITDLNFADGTSYYWRVKTKINSGQWIFSESRRFVAPTNCANASSFRLDPVGTFTYCNGTQSMIHFAWMDTTFDHYQPLFYAHYSVQKVGSEIDIGGSYGLSADVYNIAGTNSYRVRYLANPGGGMQYYYSDTIAVTYFDCSSAIVPGAPANLKIVSTSCIGLNPSVLFQFKDVSSNETSFSLEVSTEQFESDSSTLGTYNSWGRKTIASSPSVPAPPNSEMQQTNRTINFTWKDAATVGPSTNESVTTLSGALDSLDANPQEPGSTYDKIPMDGTVYFWRVKAVDAYGGSVYIYPDGGLGTPQAAGAIFFVPPCKPRYNLDISFVSIKDSSGMPTTHFVSGTDATVTVKVANVSVNTGGIPIATSPATEFYFYPHGEAGPPAMPECTSTTGLVSNPVPQDGSGAGQDHMVIELPPGSSQTITFNFNVGAIPGVPIAMAYIVPNCAAGGGGEVEYDWSNNKTPNGQSYTVDANTFFSSTGGDVGAFKQLSVGVNSTNPNRCILACTAYWQSDYLVAGRNIDNLVYGKTSPQWRLNGYSSQLPTPSGGVYSYLESKFGNKATVDICDGNGRVAGGAGNYTFAATPAYYYCGGSGNRTISAINFTGTGVIFIDGNLEIKGNVTASGAANGVVFVVSGDIAVSSSSPVVNSIDGIYIAGNGFYDTNLNGSSAVVTSAGDALTVNGAVYADGTFDKAKAFNLARSFDTVDSNNEFPSDIFNFEPKYLVILNDLLATGDVGWKEVSP